MSKCWPATGPWPGNDNENVYFDVMFVTHYFTIYSTDIPAYGDDDDVAYTFDIITNPRVIYWRIYLFVLWYVDDDDMYWYYDKSHTPQYSTTINDPTDVTVIYRSMLLFDSTGYHYLMTLRVFIRATLSHRVDKKHEFFIKFFIKQV